MPAWRATSYCSGVSRSRHSLSVVGSCARGNAGHGFLLFTEHNPVPTGSVPGVGSRTQVGTGASTRRNAATIAPRSWTQAAAPSKTARLASPDGAYATTGGPLTAPEGGEDAPAVEGGQGQVHQDRRRRIGDREPHRGVAVGNDDRLPPGAAQRAHGRVSQGFSGLHHEHARNQQVGPPP